MNERNSLEGHISDEERDADSRVDMWSAIALVLIAWGIAIFWVSGQ